MLRCSTTKYRTRHSTTTCQNAMWPHATLHCKTWLSYMSMQSHVMHSIAWLVPFHGTLHYTSLHGITWHVITCHSISTIYITTWHVSKCYHTPLAQHKTVQHITSQRVKWHCTTTQHNTLHCIALHCVAASCIVSYYARLHHLTPLALSYTRIQHVPCHGMKFDSMPCHGLALHCALHDAMFHHGVTTCSTTLTISSTAEVSLHGVVHITLHCVRLHGYIRH